MFSKKHLRRKEHFWTPTRLVLSTLTLSFFVALGLTSCNSNDEGRANPGVADRGGVRSQPAAPGMPAAPAALAALPANVQEAELRAVSGAPIKLSDYAGKVVLVNLWATWCGPCRIETPELVRLHKEYRSQGVEMVGLSTENPDASAESVRNFIHDFEVDYRIGWATPEVASSLMQGREAIPQSFVISREGRIVRRFIGFSPINTPSQLKLAIEEALKG